MENYIEFSSPEKQGLKSENIKKYISSLTEKGVCLHSLLIFRNGKLVAEGYEKHFDKDFKHRMYSVSKTFVSAAIGCLIGEGKLSLDDEVYKFFPDKCPENLHEYVRQATVRDLLTMSTPFDNTTYEPTDKDWVYTFFNTEPSHRPGRVFNYDTSATLVLDAIVERITGLDFTVYLYEKVLKYIGFDCAPECVRETGGVQWGGSGVLCTSRNLGAFAMLFMNGGKSSDGKQLIPAEYVKEATAMQICNAQSNEGAVFRAQGYGYQIWMTEFGFAFLGMGNQLAICVPEKNILAVTTADDQGNSSARDYIFDLLKKYVIDECYADDESAGNEPVCLDEFFKIPVLEGTKEKTVQDEISGKAFEICENKNGFEKISFVFSGDEGKMLYRRAGEDKALYFGVNRYVDGVFPEKYSGMTVGIPAGEGYKCTTAAFWTEKDKLVLRCYCIDRYFGNFTANISFKGGTLDINFKKTAEWFLNEYTGYLSSK